MREDATPGLLGFTRYQWLVLFAAWLGWGFDVFDGLLFNYVAPLCVPDLLGLAPKDPRALQEIPYWTGLLTSIRTPYCTSCQKVLIFFASSNQPRNNDVK